MKNTSLEAHVPGPRQYTWPSQTSSTWLAFTPRPPRLAVCGYRVSHNQQNWSGLVQKEPGRKENLPTQAPNRVPSLLRDYRMCWLHDPKAHMSGNKRIEQSFNNSFQCLTFAEYLQHKMGMGVWKNKIFVQFYTVQSLQYVMLLCSVKLNFMAGQDP